MRKSVVLGTFVVAGAGALGLGAITLNGSDTLGDLTHDLVGPVVHTGSYSSPVCAANGYSAASSIVYAGGGSGVGENNMIAGTQAVAPMSRYVKSAICTPATGAGTPSNANGIVIALDGVTLATSGSNAGSVACNGSATDTDCNPNAAEQGVGLAYNTTVPASLRTPFNASAPAYALNGWTDVLKVLFFGKVDSALHASDPEVGVNCNSSIRHALANNWGTIFENNCSSGNCTQIQHLFRRDSASGTTDIFASLLGFGAQNTTASPINTALGTWGLGADNFCNDLANTAGTEWPGSNPAKTTDNGIVAQDDQDYDPIRRTCAGLGTNKTAGNPTEQVCERGTFANGTWSAGSLGLVLVMVDDTTAPSVTSNLGGPAVQTQYDLVTDTNGTHVNRCTGGVVSVSPPSVLENTGKGSGKSATNGFCPNGDLGSNGFCLVPADNNGNPNCISFAADTPPLNGVCSTQGTSASNYSVCDTTAGSLNPQSVDPRVFNLFAWTFNTSAGAWVSTSDSSNRPVVGQYSRIHLSQAMYSTPSNTTSIDTNAPGGSTPSPLCTKNDMTDQIGCLVQASPCSVGYAGRASEQSTGPNPSGSTLAMTNNTIGMKILGVPDNTACIQSFAYRYSRKLYLNSLNGFQNATAPEQALAECESNATLIANVAATNGFIPLPDGGGLPAGDSLPTISGGGASNGLTWGAAVNGKPFCEDFNETALCGATAFPTNNNGCAANTGVGAGNVIPAQGGTGTNFGFQTTCGNGIVEQFEDCDLGTGNGAAPATCSTTCRFNF